MDQLNTRNVIHMEVIIGIKTSQYWPSQGIDKFRYAYFTLKIQFSKTEHF